MPLRTFHRPLVLLLPLAIALLAACQATTPNDAPTATAEAVAPTSTLALEATASPTPTILATATGVPIPTPTRTIAPTAVPPSPIATVQPTVAATATSGPTATPRPVSTATPAPAATRPPTPTQSGDATIAQLRLYMLDLINADRAKFGLGPVRLGSNPAAQQHADDMLAKYYIGHIDSGGMKPYMRYSLAGGLGAMGENAAYAGTDDPNDQRLYAPIIPRERLAQLQFALMYDDADSNWGHRDQILEPQHQVVNIGIAYVQTRLALIQHFEENYVTFTQPPSLTSGTLTLGGAVDTSLGRLQSVDIYFDPTPSAYTHPQLLAQPHSYSVGTSSQPVIQVVAPAPPGSFYPNLPPYVAIAQSWTGTGGTFQITANIAERITRPGVYTLLLWATGANYPLTTISLFLP